MAHAQRGVWPLTKGHTWCSYNFAARSLHTKKLCSRLFSHKLNLLAKSAKSRFVPPFGGLMGNVHGSFMARWKARGQLPISANWTFCQLSWLKRYEQILVKIVVFERRVGHFVCKFQRKGVSYQRWKNKQTNKWDNRTAQKHTMSLLTMSSGKSIKTSYFTDQQPLNLSQAEVVSTVSEASLCVNGTANRSFQSVSPSSWSVRMKHVPALSLVRTSTMSAGTRWFYRIVYNIHDHSDLSYYALTLLDRRQ